MGTFPADTALVDEVVPSPNHNERRPVRGPDILLLHYTGMQHADAALRRLCDPASQVSTHYVIFEDGSIVQSVPEERRAWHAGVSFWAGEQDINSSSIGIEIANPGHDFGYPDFPPVQIAAVLALTQDIVQRHSIAAGRVLGHSDVAPTRKQDPGEKFPWRTLYGGGVGAWVEPHPLQVRQGDDLAPGDAGAAVADMQSALRAYGYGVTPSGSYDALTEAVVAAFQRHFRPNRVDGRADASTRLTLNDLLTRSLNSYPT